MSIAPELGYLIRLGQAARQGKPAEPADLLELVFAMARLIAPYAAAEVAALIVSENLPTDANHPKGRKRAGRPRRDDEARLDEMAWLIEDQHLSERRAALVVASKDPGPKTCIESLADELRTKFRTARREKTSRIFSH